MNRQRLSDVIIIFISLFGCIFITEICLRIFSPVEDPYKKWKTEQINQYITSEFPPNYHVITQAEEGLPGVAGQNNFTTNNMGFRGDYLTMPKPENEFRIFIIGGSTTECLYLDDSKAVNAALQKELQKNFHDDLSIKVYNAGKSGDASDDHISMLVHRIIHLQPDMIIVFAGINDLTRAIYNHDYLHRTKQKSVNTFPLYRFLATEFQLPRRLHYLLKKINPTDQEILETITFKSNYKKSVDLRKSAPESDKKPRTDIHSYSNNLRTIIGVTKAHGIKLILMTQQSTWNSTVDPQTRNWHWMLYRYGVTYREDLMDNALESLNDVMRQLAFEYSIPLFDTAGIIPKSLEYFYDDTHFNTRGSQYAGEKLASYIFENNLMQIKR